MSCQLSEDLDDLVGLWPDESMVAAPLFHAMPRAARIQLTADLFAQASRSLPRERAEALERVILVNACVARDVARRYRGRGVALEDLEQTACLALVRAVHAFDPERGHDFLSYAMPSVTGGVKRHFRDLGWTVRPPRRVQEIQLLVENEQLRSEGNGTGEAAVAAIAERLGETRQTVREAMQARGCFSPVSLDAPLGPAGSGVLGDQLGDVDDRAQAAAEARIVLQPALRLLTDRDRRILKLRYADGLTQQEIGAELGVTQMHVSRLLSRILKDMLRLIEAPADRDPIEGTCA